LAATVPGPSLPRPASRSVVVVSPVPGQGQTLLRAVYGTAFIRGGGTREQELRQGIGQKGSGSSTLVDGTEGIGATRTRGRCTGHCRRLPHGTRGAPAPSLPLRLTKCAPHPGYPAFRSSVGNRKATTVFAPTLKGNGPNVLLSFEPRSDHITFPNPEAAIEFGLMGPSAILWAGTSYDRFRRGR